MIMPTLEKIFPENIRLDGETQPRVEIGQAVCDKYGERMKDGDKFPPIDVFFDGVDYWLVDGFHRVKAYVMALPGEAIECHVFRGTLQDAQWQSYAVNRTHGKQRTPKDIERAVRAALMHPNGASQSDRQIADYVGIAPSTVSKYRSKLKLEPGVQVGHLKKRTGRDGKNYPLPSGNRTGGGRRRKDSKPSRHVAGRIAQPTRTPNPMQPMTAINMPHDPFMGAMTLIEVFDVEYLRSLVNTLSKHIKELKK
jgi:hypothetical protein